LSSPQKLPLSSAVIMLVEEAVPPINCALALCPFSAPHLSYPLLS
jgi:hypothetical protein